MATAQNPTTKVLEPPNTSSRTPLLARDEDTPHSMGSKHDVRKSLTIRIPLMSIIRDCIVFNGICTLYIVHRNMDNSDHTPKYQALLLFCRLMIVWNVIAGVVNMIPIIRASRARAETGHHSTNGNDRGPVSLSRTKCILLALVDIVLSLATLAALASSITHVTPGQSGAIDGDNLPKVSIPYISLFIFLGLNNATLQFANVLQAKGVDIQIGYGELLLDRRINL